MARVRFGLFDFNPESGELFREGRVIHLQAQPAKVLALLVSANGRIVTRDELRESLWGDGTQVDFDRSLNFAVAQLRTTLGDSADSPTFIRTVPKRGYQFVAPVAAPEQEAAFAAAPQATRRWLVWTGAAGVAAVLLGCVALLWGSRAKETRIAVARFQNETGNPEWNRMADTITDSVVAGLTSHGGERYGVIGNADVLRRARSFQSLDEIASVLQPRYVVIGQVQRDGAGVRVLAHLIRLPEKTHVVVSRTAVGQSPSESQIADHIVLDLSAKIDSPASAKR